MTSEKPKSLSAYDWLRGLAHLSLGLVIVAATIYGLAHGEISSRHTDIRWSSSPILFSLNVLALTAAAMWLIRRGLSILAIRSEA